MRQHVFFHLECVYCHVKKQKKTKYRLKQTNIGKAMMSESLKQKSGFHLEKVMQLMLTEGYINPNDGLSKCCRTMTQHFDGAYVEVISTMM